MKKQEDLMHPEQILNRNKQEILMRNDWTGSTCTDEKSNRLSINLCPFKKLTVM